MSTMKYPFSPAVLDELPEELAELFRELERYLLHEICSRLNRTGELNEVTVQDIRALRSLGIDLKDIKKAIQKATKTGEKELSKLLDDVVERNQQYYTELIDAAKLTQPEVMLDSAAIEAIKAQAFEEYRNITRSMGFLVDNGRTKLEPAKAYQWALDSAVLQVQSGTTSYNRAIESAVRQLAGSGLKVVNYESGHADSVDVAVRRAVMTGVSQLNRKYTEQSMEFLQTDLVQVEAHAGARDVDGAKGWENHKKWQGKIYRWAKYTEMFPNASKKKYPDFERTCGLGDVQGILGANCRHSYSAFIEGVMERSYTDEELAHIDDGLGCEYDGKKYSAYEATQMQRRLERTIRKQKERVSAHKDAGLDEDAQTANIRLNRLETKYTEFSDAAGLPERVERKNFAFVVETARAEATQLKARRGAKTTAKELKDQENRAILKAKIESGEISTKIRPQVQARHIEGTLQFEGYKARRLAKGQTPQSILTVTMEEAQEIVDKYSCTGEVLIKTRKDGSLEIKEYADADRIVGKEYTNNNYRETSRVGIFYSKKGTHIFPTRSRKVGKNG